MNSTPHYNFKDNIKFCAVDAIDRELRRVEDKVDCAIRSLGRSGGKPGCGSWDRPPCGCSEELKQIWMALRERYSNEEIDRLILQYIREHDGDLHAHPDVLRELENLCRKLDQKAGLIDLETHNTDPESHPLILAELNKKIGLGPHGLQFHLLEMTGAGYTNKTLRYSIDPLGVVRINGWFAKSTTPVPNEIFAKLPAGFCPPLEHVAMVANNTGNYTATIQIYPNGNLVFSSSTAENPIPSSYLTIDTSFMSAQIK